MIRSTMAALGMLATITVSSGLDNGDRVSDMSSPTREIMMAPTYTEFEDLYVENRSDLIKFIGLYKDSYGGPLLTPIESPDSERYELANKAYISAKKDIDIMLRELE